VEFLKTSLVDERALIQKSRPEVYRRWKRDRRVTGGFVEIKGLGPASPIQPQSPCGGMT
jgi:hypothetical protein